MVKKREPAENESVIITNGQRRFVKKGEHDTEVTVGGKFLKNVKTESQTDTEKEEKLSIDKILEHELYRTIDGQDRTDALLTDLYKNKHIKKRQAKELEGQELKLDTVEDVEALVAKLKETE